MFEVNEFQQRRARLIKSMGAGIAIIPTAAEAIRNRDSHYPYRFDSYFYYLTGFTEPEAVLVLVAGDISKSILFCRDKDVEREIWDGFRFGPDAAKAQFGFDEAYSFSQLDEMMPKLLANQSTLFHSLGANMRWDRRVTGWLNAVKAQVRTGERAPESIRDVHQLVDNMRLIKSPYELNLMRRSGQIAAAAHNRAMHRTKKLKFEYEVEAEFLHEFRRQSTMPSYNPIVAGGANACTLHYNANDCALKEGDLLLIDAGCELEGYASDITRTFPVNGKFSAVQKDVYEMVLAAQAAAIEKAKPGEHWNAPHDAAVRVLAQGLVDFGLCEGSVDAVIETGAYRQFYMHRTGHWLGLDVHDAGDYKDKAGEWLKLQTGNVLTVEPGCYIRPADNVPEAFWNIGIRIEDDVVITKTGNEVLTKDAVKTVAEVEALMQS